MRPKMNCRQQAEQQRQVLLLKANASERGFSIPTSTAGKLEQGVTSKLPSSKYTGII